MSVKQKVNNDLTIKSDFEELEKVRKFITNQTKDFGFNENESFKIALAVDEACTNLIKYSFNQDSRNKILISISKNESYFEIKIKDSGLSFNPLFVPTPDMPEYLNKYQKGGLGIHIMRSVMDTISYEPSNSIVKWNVLTLIKSLKTNI